jgi:GNAT superfamily N-acetyltransferase
MDHPALRALSVNEAFFDLGNERFEADGATFVRNREVPDIWDANHVSRITASTPEEIDRLLERVESEFDGFRHRMFWVDPTTPPVVEGRLAMDGYQRQEMLVMLLHGAIEGEANANEIRPVENETAGLAYVALHDRDWREYRDKMPGGAGGYDEKTAEQMMRSRRSKSPPVRLWMAYVDGQPRAYCSSWGGIDGVGMLEELFTHPDFRNRGLAKALIHHGVAEARSEGAGPVVIVASPNDTPKEMYAALGFRPVAVKRDYLKRLGT